MVVPAAAFGGGGVAPPVGQRELATPGAVYRPWHLLHHRQSGCSGEFTGASWGRW